MIRVAMKVSKDGAETGSFLNVDLEVDSRRSLRPFVDALGESVAALFVGKQRSRYLAALEVAGASWQTSPDSIIIEMVNLIKHLPPPAQTFWEQATTRQFDIGIEVLPGSTPFALKLKPSTVAAVAGVNGTIAVTIYPRSTEGTSEKEGAKRT